MTQEMDLSPFNVVPFSTMISLEEWKGLFENYANPDGFHIEYTAFDNLADVPTIGGYMNGPVGVHYQRSVAAVSQHVSSLDELKEEWSKFDGLIFPYMLLYSPNTGGRIVRYGRLEYNQEI